LTPADGATLEPKGQYTDINILAGRTVYVLSGSVIRCTGTLTVSGTLIVDPTGLGGAIESTSDTQLISPVSRSTSPGSSGISAPNGAVRIGLNTILGACGGSGGSATSSGPASGGGAGGLIHLLAPAINVNGALSGADGDGGSAGTLSGATLYGSGGAGGSLVSSGGNGGTVLVSGTALAGSNGDAGSDGKKSTMCSSGYLDTIGSGTALAESSAVFPGREN